MKSPLLLLTLRSLFSTRANGPSIFFLVLFVNLQLMNKHLFIIYFRKTLANRICLLYVCIGFYFENEFYFWGRCFLTQRFCTRHGCL